MRLLRAVRRYEHALSLQPRSEPLPDRELESLSRLVRQLLAEDADNLSRAASERDRLAAVLDQLADGVLLANSSGEIQYSNPAAGRLFQVPNAVDRTITEVLRDHRLVDAWRLSVNTGGLHSESVELPTS